MTKLLLPTVSFYSFFLLTAFNQPAANKTTSDSTSVETSVSATPEYFNLGPKLEKPMR